MNAETREARAFCVLVGTLPAFFYIEHSSRTARHTQALPRIHAQTNNTRATYSLDTSPLRPPPYIRAMAQFQRVILSIAQLKLHHGAYSRQNL